MLERVSQLAEQVAMKASRREFLSGLSRAAAAAAGVVGGLLLTVEAQGRTGDGRCVRCYYRCSNGSTFYVDQKNRCSKTWNGCGLWGTDSCGR
jgi:hypothetical protein